jgi:hypothetical protein
MVFGMRKKDRKDLIRDWAALSAMGADSQSDRAHGALWNGYEGPP